MINLKMSHIVLLSSRQNSELFLIYQLTKLAT